MHIVRETVAFVWQVITAASWPTSVIFKAAVGPHAMFQRHASRSLPPVMTYPLSKPRHMHSIGALCFFITPCKDAGFNLGLSTEDEVEEEKEW
jgi:hypothetical protein